MHKCVKNIKYNVNRVAGKYLTDVDSIVSHHVLVVVESMLVIITLLALTKKPLHKQRILTLLEIPHAS